MPTHYRETFTAYAVGEVKTKPLQEHHEDLAVEHSKRRTTWPPSDTPQTVLFPTQDVDDDTFDRLDVTEVQIDGAPYLVNLNEVRALVRELIEAGDTVFVVPTFKSPRKEHSDDPYDLITIRGKIAYHVYFSSRPLEVKDRERSDYL